MSRTVLEPEPEPTDSIEELSLELGALALATCAETLPVAASSRDPANTLTILENPRFAADRVLAKLEPDFGRRFALRTSQPQDLRFYVVWKIPGCDTPTRFSGLHIGLGSRAYSQILTLNNNTFIGLPFKRVDYLREPERQQAPVEFAARLFYILLAMIQPVPSLKVGASVYLKLESFEPEWRQALVIRIRKQNLVLAVRALEAELEEKWEKVSFFELEGKKFIMVVGEMPGSGTSSANPVEKVESVPHRFALLGSQPKNPENRILITINICGKKEIDFD